MINRWEHLCTVNYQLCLNEEAKMSLDGVRVGPTLLFVCVQLYFLLFISWLLCNYEMLCTGS